MSNTAKKEVSTPRMVKVFIPRREKTDIQREVWVGDKSYAIQTGKWVEVPEPVARILDQSQKASEEAEERIRRAMKNNEII